MADQASTARLGRVTTAHGSFDTPAFMPVGTQGTVKALTQEMLEDAGAEIILGNAYHLFLRPGHLPINRLGGLHKFIGWDRPILTDSGGFQVFSLGDLRKITPEGVQFRSHIDGSQIFLTPEGSIDIQAALGPDIVMCFDECTPYPASRSEVEKSLELTLAWAKRSKDRFLGLRQGTSECEDVPFRVVNRAQALFGIIQGGMFSDLRERSIQELIGIGFDGYAIGGLSVGEDKDSMFQVIENLTPFMPESQPRYLMGVGSPEDIVNAVALGVDMFDCVLPTRNARNGQLFTSKGRLNIKNTRYREDPGPIDESCACPVCRRYSRAYLRHLYFSREVLGSVLNSLHNVRYYLDMMKRMRQSMKLGTFDAFRTSLLNDLACGGDPDQDPDTCGPADGLEPLS
ncbi:MAG TPA: tRNA guanosine(34) transglycosylase Tgt [Blastocatellia bacterium]